MQTKSKFVLAIVFVLGKRKRKKLDQVEQRKNELLQKGSTRVNTITRHTLKKINEYKGG